MPHLSEDCISPRGNTPHCASVQWFLTLGGDDIEDGVPDREQVDSEREKVEVGEKQERDKHEETTNARSKHVTSWMACRWSEMRTETP